MAYFNDIKLGIRTTLKGLGLTFRHIRNATQSRKPQGIADPTYFDQQNGLVTLQYPHEQFPIPDNGRYRLRNEIDDCIVCDKCAKICPVDCITIDAIKATEEVGRASDGSPIRLYAAKFDIDMAKCCYCGLCTAVCPTECLTMDKKFDYSEFELGKLTYEFANLTAEAADEKRSLYEQFLREKEEQKAAQAAAKAVANPASENSAATSPVAKPRPAFRPTAKPAAPAPPSEPANSEGSSIEHPLTDATPEEMQQIAQGGLETVKKPVFRPTKKPVIPADVPLEARKDEPEQEPTVTEKPAEDTPKPKAAPGGFRPTMKPPKPASSEPVEEPADPTASDVAKPKPAFRPTMKPPKPVTEEPVATAEPQTTSEIPAPPSIARPAFRPTMKPKAIQPDVPTISDEAESKDVTNKSVSEIPAPPEVKAPTQKSPGAFRPTMKPKPVQPIVEPAESKKESSTEEDVTKPQETPVAEVPKPKPAFRPTMKPKVAPPKPPSDDEVPSV